MKEETGSGPQLLRFIAAIIKVLRTLGGVAETQIVIDGVIKELRISDKELQMQLPGGESRVRNQIRLARLYLKQAGFLEPSARGIWKLSEKGRSSPSDSKTALTIYHKVRTHTRKRRGGRIAMPPVPKRVARIAVPSDGLMTLVMGPKVEPPPPSEPKKDPGAKVELFYGTNRNRTGESDLNDWYGTERGELICGTCEVSIPRGHKEGVLERPTWWLPWFPESVKRHVVLTRLEELAADRFLSDFRSRIGEAPDHDALLFVHGFNNTFAFAAQRTAQLAHDLSFQGVPCFFSWPSAEDTSPTGYWHDHENSEWSVPHFEEFVENLLLQTEVQKLHIIAHSMGNNLMTLTLRNLSDKTKLAESLKRIHQVMLCAPDVDRDIFRTQLLPKMLRCSTQITMYSSDKDKALKLSKAIRQGLPRLGEAGENLLVVEDMDTVDASNVKTDWLGHGYFLSTQKLIEDIHHVVCNELPPLKRNLRQRMLGTLPYWLFPETV